MGSPINYAAPTNKAPAMATVNKTNPYLISSPYENMQLHTPSGLYYNHGKVYESYTPEARVYNAPPILNPMMGGFMYANGPLKNNNQGSWSGGPVEGSIQSGQQYFKPFTGNADGIINGDISMVYGNKPSYQPQPLADLFPSLNANLLQSNAANTMQGVEQYLGNNLLSSPIVTTNTQGK